jgi:hypothetical protein
MRNASIQDSLGRFLENSGSEPMNDVAGQLLELLEADEVEPVGNPGDPVSAEEIAERLETRLARLRKRSDAEVEGLGQIEDAVAYLQANDDTKLVPWTFEDSDGIRWFVLADEDDDIVACYTSAPFVEADM